MRHLRRNTTAPAAAPTETPPPPGPTPDPNIPVAVIPTPAPGDPAAIANYNTAIFGGPGTNYVVYAALNGGKTVKVVGKSEDGLWWAVSVPVAPTGAGWVNSGWVTVKGVEGVPVLPTPPAPPTTELIPPGPTDPQVNRHRECICTHRSGGQLPGFWHCPSGGQSVV